MTVTTFSELELDESLLNALESKGFTRPTAIQAAAIPPALEGRDVLGSAPTGTGRQQPTCCLCCSICSTFRVKIRPAAHFDPDPDP